VRGELKRLQRAVGITFLFVTHDQEEALALSDRLAVMNQGRLEQTGTPEEIYRRPKSRFVAGFVGGSNLIEGRVSATGPGQVALTTPGGRRLTGPCGEPGPAVGSVVTLMVRPEAVRLGSGEGQKLSGTIISYSYLGSYHQVIVDVEPGLRVVAQATGEGAPATGQAVEIWWPTAEGLVLEA